MAAPRAPGLTETITSANGFVLSPTDDAILQMATMATDVIVKEEFIQGFSPSSSSGSGSRNGSVSDQMDSCLDMSMAKAIDMELSSVEPAMWNGVSPDLPWMDSVSTLSSNGSPPDSASTMSLSTYVPHFIPQLSSPVDRALFNHYTTVVSGILSRRPSTSNPYTTSFPVSA